MKMKRPLIKALAVFLALLLGAPQGVIAQSEGGDKPFKQEELDQLVAPIALYPDSLLAQVFMASTYPLEVVLAGRWVKANQKLKGDALTAALEKEDWDPSVKSLVNFPQVLDMMNEKLDWTQKLGDAFLAQEKDVMDTVQKLRLKAYGEGNLKTSEQQKVVVEEETKTIIIEPANPQVVYVPTYNPTVVYGAWPYPSYPPYYYYPPGYVPGAALFSFGVGVAMGAAWGYAWGGCGWGVVKSMLTSIGTRTSTTILTEASTRTKYRPARAERDRGSTIRSTAREPLTGTRALLRSTTGEDREMHSHGIATVAESEGRRDLSKGAADRSRGGQQMDRGSASAGQKDRGGPSVVRMDRGGSSTRDASSRGHQSMSSSRSGGGGGGASWRRCRRRWERWRRPRWWRPRWRRWRRSQVTDLEPHLPTF